MRLAQSLFIAAVVTLVGVAPAWCQDSQSGQYAKSKAMVYVDKRGNKVTFPMGVASFADELVYARVGKPAPKAKFFKPLKVLGPPDRVSMAQEQKVQSSCSMGRGGELVVRFKDNALIDVPGPDLYVFEIGPKVESTNLWISEDGSNWINIGKIAGATAAVDISPFVKKGQVFRYVKLKDVGNSSGQYAGADIDAIGAIGSAYQITLDSSVLFDLDKAVLKPEAKVILKNVVKNLGSKKYSSIQIHGHTDNQGTDAYNLKLSKRRAEAVKNFLMSGCNLDGNKLSTEGYGESRPVANNATKRGQQLNRRVELVVSR